MEPPTSATNIEYMEKWTLHVEQKIRFLKIRILEFNEEHDLWKTPTIRSIFLEY